MKRYLLILVISLLTAMTSQVTAQDDKPKRCEAIAKTTKVQCKNRAQPGKTVCKVHDRVFQCGATTRDGQSCRNTVKDKTEKTPEKRCWRHNY